MSAPSKNTTIANHQPRAVKKTRRAVGRPQKAAPQDKPTSPRNQNVREDSTNFLSLYFREMSNLDVLKPKQEFESAEEIENLEVNIWVRVLGNPETTDYLSRRIENALEEAPSFRSVRRAATIARKTPTRTNLTSLNRAIIKMGIELRDHDKDRIVLEQTIAHIRQLAAKSDKTVSFSTSTTSFRKYVRQIESAERSAQRARNEFVKANLRLVVSVARRFNHGRMSLADLIQEGNIGLMKAVERYDYRKGFRFSTYASWWIRHAISRALADKGREVRLPVHMIDAHHRIARAKRELTAKLSRPPTSEELAEATDMGVSKIERMRTYLLDGALSLDKPVNDEDGRSFADVLQDPASIDDELIDRLTSQTQTSQVRLLLKELKPIEADILRQRFGLDDDQEHTLKQIGTKYNLSRERIRQLQEQALGKMRRAMTTS